MIRRPLALLLPLVVLLAACADDPLAVTAPERADFARNTPSGWVVNSLEDTDDGACTSAHCTLREALGAAQKGDRITFKSNLAGTIVLGSTLQPAVDVTIAGPGPNRLALSGDNSVGVMLVRPAVHVQISGLTVRDGQAIGGGGILVQGELTATEVVIRNNTAAFGGGLYIAAGVITLERSTIAGNRATQAGGGIHQDIGTLVLDRSTMSGNQAPHGGGISSYGGTVKLTSSTITSNAADNTGGGVVNTGAYLYIGNTLLAGNRAGNSATHVSADCYNEFDIISFGYNLTSQGTGCPLAVSSDVAVFPSQVFTQVLQPTVAENGGPTPTHALIERGFAVDAGSCPGEVTDQRGMTRPYDEPLLANARDACDIGAFEWQPVKTGGKGTGSKK